MTAIPQSEAWETSNKTLLTIIQGKPRSDKMRQVRAQSKIVFPFLPACLQLRQHFCTPRKLDFTPQHKNIPSEGCNRASPRHSGHQIWPSEQATQVQKWTCGSSSFLTSFCFVWSSQLQFQRGKHHVLAMRSPARLFKN